jgi:hypothetical protein
MAGRGASSADRLLVSYFIAGAVAIALRRDHIAGWPYFVLLHAVCIVVIIGLVWTAERWPAAHAWYPLAMAILMFEEVALLNFMFVGEWQDRHVLGFEEALFGEPPGQWLARFASPIVTELLAVGYFSYYLMLPAVGAVLYRRRENAAFEAFMSATLRDLRYVSNRGAEAHAKSPAYRAAQRRPGLVSRPVHSIECRRPR